MEPTRYIARGGDVRETIRLGATLVDWRHIAVLRIAPAWLSGYAVVILLVTVLVNLATQLARTAYGLTLPAMRDSLGLSYSQAGSLIAAVSIFLMIASLTFGMLAPRYGSRYIVGASTIAAGVAMVFLGASPSFPIALLTSAAIGFAAGWCYYTCHGLAVGLVRCPPQGDRGRGGRRGWWHELYSHRRPWCRGLRGETPKTAGAIPGMFWPLW